MQADFAALDEPSKAFWGALQGPHSDQGKGDVEEGQGGTLINRLTLALINWNTDRRNKPSLPRLSSQLCDAPKAPGGLDTRYFL